MTAPPTSALGQFIREQRQLARLSLRELSRLTSVSNAYLSQVERGVHEPSLRVLRALANALGVPFEELVRRSDGGAADEPRTKEPVEQAIRQDDRLSPAQKEALLGVFRGFLDSGTSASGRDADVARPFTLRDGQEGVIWPLLSTDRRTTREGFLRLSERSRRHRFLHNVPEQLSEEMLDRLVSQVDGKDHVAVVAVVLPDDGPEELAGIARIVRYPDEPAAADVAVTVLDEWQGKGIGAALADEVVRRRPAGVTSVVTYVDPANRASLALLRRMGPATVTRDGPGSSKVVVELDPVA